MPKRNKLVPLNPEQFYSDFPGLNKGNHTVSSPAGDTYNCIAFVVGDKDNWWWPPEYADAIMGRRFVFWPLKVKDDEPNYTIDNFVAALATERFTPCENGILEKGIEKIALFGDANRVRHAALQLTNRNGRWKSKMGDNVDIEHELRAVEGDIYGKLLIFLCRPRR